MADESDPSAHRDPETSGGPVPLSWVPKVGVWAWSFVGFVAATVIVVTALGAVSEIVLPLTFAAVLAVIFKKPLSEPWYATGSSPPWPLAWSSSVCSP